MDIASAFNANRAEGDALTSQEIMDATGRSRNWCNNMIRRGVNDGTIEYAGKKDVPNITGAIQPRASYKLVRKVVV